jgi:formamidase
MPETLIKVDLTKSAYDNDMIHNRWHPDVPIVAWVKPGDDFIIETVDWTGGFIKNNDSADDVRDIDLSIVTFSPARSASRAPSPVTSWSSTCSTSVL